MRIYSAFMADDQESWPSKRCNQVSDQGIISLSKFLIPVANVSTDRMEVTTLYPDRTIKEILHMLVP